MRASRRAPGPLERADRHEPAKTVLPLGALALGLALGALALGPGGCTYDFDAAFSEAGGSSSTGGGGTTTTSSSSGASGGEQPSGGGGSGASAATGGSGGSGGSGGVGGENCSNGIDDDGDQLVDCADPICTDYQCATTAPASWTGPVAIYRGAAAPPACGSRWPTALTGGRGSLSVPMAECSDCTCDAPTGASCGLGSVEFYQDTACGELMQTITPLAADQCYTFSVGADDSSIGLDIPITGAACTAAGGVPTLPPVTWSEQARICSGAVLGGGCGTGEVCAPRPTDPFEAAHCIVRTGNVNCPTGPYSVKTLVYTGIDDTRDCSSCSCEDPTGMSCSGTSEIYPQPGCADTPTIQPHNGTTCAMHGTSRSLIFHVSSGPGVGQCSPLGGNATGFAFQTDQVTVCCLP